MRFLTLLIVMVGILLSSSALQANYHPSDGKMLVSKIKSQVQPVSNDVFFVVYKAYAAEESSPDINRQPIDITNGYTSSFRQRICKRSKDGKYHIKTYTEDTGQYAGAINESISPNATDAYISERVEKPDSERSSVNSNLI